MLKIQERNVKLGSITLNVKEIRIKAAALMLLNESISGAGAKTVDCSTPERLIESFVQNTNLQWKDVISTSLRNKLSIPAAELFSFVQENYPEILKERWASISSQIVPSNHTMIRIRNDSSISGYKSKKIVTIQFISGKSGKKDLFWKCPESRAVMTDEKTVIKTSIYDETDYSSQTLNEIYNLLIMIDKSDKKYFPKLVGFDLKMDMIAVKYQEFVLKSVPRAKRTEKNIQLVERLIEKYNLDDIYVSRQSFSNVAVNPKNCQAMIYDVGLGGSASHTSQKMKIKTITKLAA